MRPRRNARQRWWRRPRRALAPLSFFPLRCSNEAYRGRTAATLLSCRPPYTLNFHFRGLEWRLLASTRIAIGLISFFPSVGFTAECTEWMSRREGGVQSAFLNGGIGESLVLLGVIHLDIVGYEQERESREQKAQASGTFFLPFPLRGCSAREQPRKDEPGSGRTGDAIAIQ